MNPDFAYQMNELLGNQPFALVAIYDPRADVFGEYFTACGGEGVASFAELASQSRGAYRIDTSGDDAALVFASGDVAYLRRIFQYKANELSARGHSYSMDSTGGLFDQFGIYPADGWTRDVFANHCSERLWVSEPYFPSWS